MSSNNTNVTPAPTYSAQINGERFVLDGVSSRHDLVACAKSDRVFVTPPCVDCHVTEMYVDSFEMREPFAASFALVCCDCNETYAITLDDATRTPDPERLVYGARINARWVFVVASAADLSKFEGEDTTTDAECDRCGNNHMTLERTKSREFADYAMRCDCGERFPVGQVPARQVNA